MQQILDCEVFLHDQRKQIGRVEDDLRSLPDPGAGPLAGHRCALHARRKQRENYRWMSRSHTVRGSRSPVLGARQVVLCTTNAYPEQVYANLFGVQVGDPYMVLGDTSGTPCWNGNSTDPHADT